MNNEMQNAQILKDFSHIAVYSLATVLNVGCAILLLRTAAGVIKSRFLKHLAASLFINAASTIVSITYLLIKVRLASALNTPNLQANQIQNTFDLPHEGITTFLSLLSTYFLFMVWNLLRRYPKEGVDRSLFNILTACFGSSGLLVGLISLVHVFERVREHLWAVIHFIDLTSSTAGLLLVGWQLQRTLGSEMKTENYVSKVAVPWITLLAYFICGASQLFHELLKEFTWYSTLLIMSTFSAIIMTIILCSYTLDEKPEYNSSNQESG